MWNQLKDWIYPDKCIVCGRLLSPEKMLNHYICERCEVGRLEHHVCQRCGKPYAVEDTCIYCGEMPKGISQIKSLFPYKELYKESVLRWKYTGIRKYAKGYGELVATHFIEEKNLSIELLIPIPIADKRYKQRGFNQARDLADVVSQHTGIPVWDGLRRTKNTKPQSSCDKRERSRNIRGTIVYDQKIEPLRARRIAFVDDIYTTGSTVNECIKVIKQNIEHDIEEVFIFTVCMAI